MQNYLLNCSDALTHVLDVGIGAAAVVVCAVMHCDIKLSVVKWTPLSPLSCPAIVLADSMYVYRQYKPAI